MKTYIPETTYSFLSGVRRRVLSLPESAPEPTSEFENQIADALAEAAAYLMNEEFGLALAAYKQIAGLLVHTVDPNVPPNIGVIETFKPPLYPELIDPLILAAARTLTSKAVVNSTVPKVILNPKPQELPPAVSRPMAAWHTLGSRAKSSPSGMPLRADVVSTSSAITAADPHVREIGHAAAAAHAIDPAPPRIITHSADRVGVAVGPNVVAIDLDGDAASGVRNFYQKRVTSSDMAIIGAYLHDNTQTLLYLPHIYFFVVPMAIGDCYAALGSFADAEASYLAVLGYAYLNGTIETVALWTRIAELYLAWGDSLYRAAGNDRTQYAGAKARYEKIVTAANTIDVTSPLYANSHFNSIRTRVQNILAANDPLALGENPRITAVLLGARQRLTQLTHLWNFFGLDPDYIPPFSFEYLQNTARYLSQQAGRIGQMYINFKSHAETEELARDQLAQQADLAAASVQLEQLGESEASAGLTSAKASAHYADVQAQNAVDARDGFAAVRWELLELSSLEAWSSAASMDEDDEVQQSISGTTYYSTSDRRRSMVLYDLANKRTRISHDLEADRLQREVTSTQAYKQVAQAQVAQAQARVAVAQQRVAIAKLQARSAADNRNFVDGKEFSYRTWYELARVSRGLTQRYLDMATAAAFLMQRAYLLETGRDLQRIRFDLASSAATGLMAGDLLLADIDSFTQDYLVTQQARRAPGKQVISIADSYPTAFSQLIAGGRCSFETSFAQFERGTPGAWLSKLRNVEVVFVGITSAAGLQGTLRNIGISRVRRVDGTEISVPAAADVLPLSQYEARNDALLFRLNSNELRVFENCGLATRWQLDLPLDANTFDYRQILDVQLVLYYDGFYDTQLETTVRAALPKKASASRAFSMAMMFTDELFYLRNQGRAEIAIDAGLLPANQTVPKRTRLVLRATGGNVANLTFRLQSAESGADLVLTTDGSGVLDSSTSGSALAPLVGRTLFDRWTLSVGDAATLAALSDLQLFVEYDYTFRGAV